MQTELDRLGAQISKALNEEISLSQVSPLDFRTISNAILASSSVSLNAAPIYNFYEGFQLQCLRIHLLQARFIQFLCLH